MVIRLATHPLVALELGENFLSVEKSNDDVSGFISMSCLVIATASFFVSLAVTSILSDVSVISSSNHNSIAFARYGLNPFDPLIVYISKVSVSVLSISRHQSCTSADLINTLTNSPMVIVSKGLYVVLDDDTIHAVTSDWIDDL